MEWTLHSAVSAPTGLAKNSASFVLCGFFCLSFLTLTALLKSDKGTMGLIVFSIEKLKVF